MARTLLIEQDVLPVFDRQVLTRQTLDDEHLAAEVLGMFLSHLKTLQAADWSHLEIAFEMHKLKGAAASVGALEIQAIADDWKQHGRSLQSELRHAMKRFVAAA